jgi:hypothetical protein
MKGAKAPASGDSRVGGLGRSGEESQAPSAYPSHRPEQTVADDFGSVWVKHGPDCDLHVVRPGKAQCNCPLDYGEKAAE